MSQRTYVVTGMSCEHCVAAVTQEVTALAGVTQVDVDLATGRLQVTSTGPLADDSVREAVEEAGYELGPVRS